MNAKAPARPVLLLAALLGFIASPARPAPFPAADTLPAEVSARLSAQSAALRAEAVDAASRRLRGEKAPGSLNAIVLSCDFADSLLLGRYGVVPGDFPPPRQSDRHYSAHDSTFLHHKLQDVAAYFADVSGGALEINFAIHPRVVNLPHPMSWYGNHPERGEQQVALAADVVDSLDLEVDFTAYDTVVLVHAGAGEETDILGDSPEQVYSTYLNPADFRAAWEDSLLPHPYLPAAGFAEGTGIDRVLVLPETEQQDPYGSFRGGFGSLGVYCFEFGLHLGMLSLSDFTPSGRPDSQGVGQYDLMGYGLFVGLGFLPPQPGPFNKLLMGWLAPRREDPDAGGTVVLRPASGEHGLECARIDISGQEYWLAEYRLQDPDGNRRFGFPGDLNGNGLPDFWDADSQNGDGTPTGKFDAATDTHEDLRGAEWDFAMSENNARLPGELGAGSGVFVWHVDEAVVAAAFGQPSNLFNADPARKSVDLEEADGVQDLDSNEPSDWQLGGDDDSFRGEDNALFGPDTRPDTRSNAGPATGIVMSNFSNVVLDSAAYVVEVGGFQYPGYDYADSMTFTLSRAAAGPGARLPSARLALPAGVDLTGSHLLAVDLDGTGGQEIVAADSGGRVWAFNGDLSGFIDRDDDGSTVEPFAAGSAADGPAAWILPAAAGDIDGDGRPEVLLATAGGIYAFDAAGEPLRAAAPGDEGLYEAVAGCNQPVVLAPVEPGSTMGDPRAEVTAIAAWARDGDCGIELRGGGGYARTILLGSGHLASAPQVVDRWLVCCIADTGAGTGRLAVVDLYGDPVPSTPEVVSVPLHGVPGAWPAVIGPVNGAEPATGMVAITVLSADGGGETVVLDDSRAVSGAARTWTTGADPQSPPGPGGAMLAGGGLARVGQGGDWLDGWPRSVSPPVAPSRASALVCRLLDAPGAGDHYLFTDGGGRLLARGARGEDVAGWPLQGPAAAAGTPALGSFGGGAELDLAAVGAFPRVTGNSGFGSELVTDTVSEIVVWTDVASATARWPMWGGSSWRNGDWDTDGFVGVPAVATGSGLVPGSHFCYPNPASGGMVRARAQSRSPGRALVTVHDLAGEQVAATAWREIPAAEPFTVEVSLAGVVPGMYLCRLVVVGTDGRSEESVVTFAVER